MSLPTIRSGPEAAHSLIRTEMHCRAQLPLDRAQDILSGLKGEKVWLEYKGASSRLSTG